MKLAHERFSSLLRNSCYINKKQFLLAAVLHIIDCSIYIEIERETDLQCTLNDVVKSAD